MTEHLPRLDDGGKPIELLFPDGLVCDKHGSHAQVLPNLNLVYLQLLVVSRFMSSPVAQRMAGRDDATGALADASKMPGLAEQLRPLCCWMGERWWAELERIAAEPVRGWEPMYAELDRVREQFGEERG